METTFRQALFLTRGSVVDLAARPLTAAILVVTLAAFLAPVIVHVVRRGRVPAVAGGVSGGR
jgi:TctA family transporter